MTFITPLYLLWSDIQHVAAFGWVLWHKRESREAAEIRESAAAEIKSKVASLQTRLRSGEAANVGEVDGTDGKQWAAGVAALAYTMGSQCHLLANPALDDADLSRLSDALSQLDNASEYLRALQQIDNRPGFVWEPKGSIAHEALTAETISHTDDFRTVIWHGETLTFSKNQAAVVALIWRCLGNGAELSGAYLLQEAEIANERVDMVFRESAAWKRMILPGNKRGAYRLAEPAKPLPKSAKKTRPVKNKKGRAAK